MIVKQDYAINANFNIGAAGTNDKFKLNGYPYSAGEGINISEQNVISVDPNVLPEYTAGQGIAINDKEISIKPNGIIPSNLNLTEGSTEEARAGGPGYLIDEWTGMFDLYIDKWTELKPISPKCGLCTATIRRFSDDYQEATYILKFNGSPTNYFYLRYS